jgi:hypothetical protein
MAKTAAERQKEYRAKRAFSGPDGNGEREIKAWVSTGSYLTFKRLAKRYGVTNQALLERLIANEEEKVLHDIGENSAEIEKYLYGNIVTP